MKKIFAIVFVALLFFSLSCGKKLTTYTEINYAQYLEKMKNKETFPLVIGSESCSACALYKGTMDTFIKKYQVEVFYIDLSKLTEEEENKLYGQVNFDGTPTTVFIELGEYTSVFDRIEGSAGLSTVKEKFRKNNYID